MTVQEPLRIKDVAARAGVSPATVSRVLNGTATVGEAKRALVTEAIEELGYRPNRLASNFRRLKSEMIGVVVSDIENPHFTQMVRAVEDAAHARGYRVLLCNTDEDPGKQHEYLAVLAQERVAGVIISPTAGRGLGVAGLLDHGISVVAFDRVVRDKRADAVVAANAAGAHTAAAHLIGSGRRRVGFVGGPAGVQTAEERLAGYEQAIAEAGLKSLTADGHFRTEGGREATHGRLEQGATAILVANNLMAIGALQAIKERGLSIPGDVGIVSIDDPPWAQLTDPPLTTLAQPVREMAQAAVELLFERLAGGRTNRRRRVFDLQLVHRGSCCEAGR